MARSEMDEDDVRGRMLAAERDRDEQLIHHERQTRELRARIAELEQIEQRARDVLNADRDLGDWHELARHILGEPY